MKMFFTTIAANLVSLLLASGAVLLAYKGQDGWGWFLFGSIISTGAVHLTKEGKAA